jgi:hypothetical protein
MIFVCILLILWFLKAMRRLARTILLRRSLIFGNVVQIQGLASYLAYFDGATRAHLNSIVETRQSKPAVPMEIMYISCLFESIQLFPTANPEIVQITVKLTVTIPGKLYLLNNFNPATFKKMVHQYCMLQNSSSKIGYRDVGTIFRETIFATNRSKIGQDSGFASFPFLSAQEVCMSEGYVHSIDSTGSVVINVAIKSPFSSNFMDKEMYDISLCFVPDSLLRDTFVNSIFNRKEDVNGASSVLSFAETDPALEQEETFYRKSRDSREGTQGLLSSATTLSTVAHRVRHSTCSTSEGVTGSRMMRNACHSVMNSLNDNVYNQQPDGVRQQTPMASPVENGAVDIESAIDAASAPNNSTTDTSATPAPLKQFPASDFANQAATVTALRFSLPRYLPGLFPSANEGNPTPSANSDKQGGYRQKKDLHPKELIVIDKHGQVYNSVEVFGLGVANEVSSAGSNPVSPTLPNGAVGALFSPPAVFNTFAPSLSLPNSSHASTPSEMLSHPTRVAPEAFGNHSAASRASLLQNQDAMELNNIIQSQERENPGHQPSSAAETGKDASPTSGAVSSLALAQGGKYLAEECVVCLTDPKEILLLPCRHLCVCAACFVFVDKCPVCRALFDEYIAIQGGTKMTIQSRR